MGHVRNAHAKCVSWQACMSDVAFADWLTQKVGVAALPMSVFYQDKQDNKVLRFCFAKGEETLKAAAGKLSAI